VKRHVKWNGETSLTRPKRTVSKQRRERGGRDFQSRSDEGRVMGNVAASKQHALKLVRSYADPGLQPSKCVAYEDARPTQKRNLEKKRVPGRKQRREALELARKSPSLRADSEPRSLGDTSTWAKKAYIWSDTRGNLKKGGSKCGDWNGRG